MKVKQHVKFFTEFYSGFLNQDLPQVITELNFYVATTHCL